MRKLAFLGVAGLFAAMLFVAADVGAQCRGGRCAGGPAPAFFPAQPYHLPAPPVVWHPPAPAKAQVFAKGEGPFDGQPARRGGVEFAGKALEWREYHSQRGMFYLHDAQGNRVGAWKEKTCQFWPLAGRTWGAECRPPCDLPRTREVQPDLNFGVVQSKISEAPRYWVGDKVVSRDECVRAIVEAGEELKDDSGKMRVTFFGPEAKTAPLKAAVKAQGDLDAEVLVQAYEVNDPMVAGLGFQTGDADVTVYCQAPAGKVLHRQPGADDVPGTVEAIRKANASYKAAADPNLAKGGPLSLPSFDLTKVPQWLWLVIAAAGVWWLLEPKK